MNIIVRQVLGAILIVAVGSALVYYFLDEPSWDDVGLALFLIAIWAPLKGVIFRRFGGHWPYQSAVVANASSQLAGLPFHFSLSFWPRIGVSFLVTGAIEAIALLAVGTVATVKRSLGLSFYASLVVHLITAGWFVSQRSVGLGLPFLLVGIVLFHLPAFFTDRLQPDSPFPGASERR